MLNIGPILSDFINVNYLYTLHAIYQNMIIVLLTVCLIFGVRLLYLLYIVHTDKPDCGHTGVLEPVTVAIIIGSGGHTAEMLRLLRRIDLRFINPRKYIMASSDVSSESTVHDVERRCLKSRQSDYEIIKIPRSRFVGQSYITSIFTTLYATLFSVPVLFQIKPRLIMCNGPGTCIPICIIAFLLRILWLLDTKILFVESVCRVNTLSLSGKILLLIADEILVQWPQLKKYGKRIRVVGRIT